MSDITVARRYAGALYEQAAQNGVTEAVDADVALIRDSLQASSELGRFFDSPVISRAKKQAVVEQLFSPKVHALTLGFLQLLVAKRRENLFPSVVQAYRQLRDTQLGMVEVQARVAQPLDAAGEKQLTEVLAKKTGKQVRLTTKTDPSLLGGIVIRIGDMVYDGSVRHQLNTLRAKLSDDVLHLN